MTTTESEKSNNPVGKTILKMKICKWDKYWNLISK